MTDALASFAPMVKSVTIIGCGWLGKALAIALIRNGISVKGTTTSPQKLEELKAIGILPFLLESGMSSTQASSELRSDAVVVTVPPSRRLIEAESLAIHERLIGQLEGLHDLPLYYTSSTSVYPDDDGVFTEEDALPESLLLGIEKLYRSSFTQCTIVRLGGLFGPDRNPARFFSGKKNVPRPLAPVNMTHQSDGVQALMTLMASGKSGIYNAVSPEHPSRIDFYTRAAIASGMEAPDFDRTDLSKGKVVSSSKLMQDVGYSFQCHNPLDCI